MHFLRFLRSPFERYLSPILGVVSLSQIFDVTWGEFGNFFVSITPFILSGKPFYLVLSILFFFFFYTNFRHRHTPLTIVDTDIVLTLETPTGDRATLERTQRIRANRYEVTGYSRVIKVDKGQIPEDTYKCEISHCPHNKQSHRLFGDPKSWFIVHRFDEIPRSWVKFGTSTVIRKERLIILNEYTNDEEYYEFGVPLDYPTKIVTVKIYFHEDRIPEIKDCKAIGIRTGAVTDVDLQNILPSGETSAGIRMHVKAQPGDRYRISWKFPPLNAPQRTP